MYIELILYCLMFNYVICYILRGACCERLKSKLFRINLDSSTARKLVRCSAASMQISLSRNIIFSEECNTVVQIWPHFIACKALRKRFCKLATLSLHGLQALMNSGAKLSKASEASATAERA